MRNLLTVVFGVLLIALAGTGPAQSGDATFKLTNKAPSSILVKVFGPGRSWQWPSSTKHWTLDDGAQHALRVACKDGEQVCFGGSTADNKTHWGAGLKGDRRCKSCCLTCGTNVSHSWSLLGRVARPAGGAIDPGTNLVPVDE